MKIIGGNDYYDKGMQYGVDDSTLLIRDNKKLKNFVYFPPACDLPRVKDSTDRTWERVYVVVADRLYSGIIYSPRPEETEYLWTEESFEKLMERVSAETPNPRYLGFYYGIKNIPFKNYFEVKDTPHYIKTYMIENGISILVGEDKREFIWTANPDTLKKIEFFKVIDAFTLYQTLDMWISGVLPSSPNMVEITDDKVKIQKHGFDLKTSFRKASGK